MTRWRKARVYLDTSVISYMEQDDAPEKRDITREFWEMLKVKGFEVVISNVVQEELMRCGKEKREKLVDHLKEVPYEYIHTNDETRCIARKFVELGVLKEKSFDDGQHLSVAMYSKCDMLVSWNLKHIVAIKTLVGMRHIGALMGYHDLFIATPAMFLEGDYDAEMPDFE